MAREAPEQAMPRQGGNGHCQARSGWHLGSILPWPSDVPFSDLTLKLLEHFLIAGGHSLNIAKGYEPLVNDRD